ncbi:MAG TPA: glycosyltransferase family 2 protein [Negativicutes bacterium]|nr:glycosyltransferase family 2 protein [Negativicutes bacterium]
MISIIMPAYNMEAYIGESILSVLSQTFRDWELIVINDGSTDDTSHVVRRFSDDRIRLIEQNNKGVSAARNAGLDSARGAYVSFLDADDLWDITFLQSLFAAIRNHTFAYSGYRKLHENGRISKYKYKYCNGSILKDALSMITWVHFGAMLVDRRILDGIRFTEGVRSGEDLEFIYKVLSRADAVAVPRELATYRFRPGSASKQPHKDPDNIVKRTKRLSAFFNDPEYDSLLAELMARGHFRAMWGKMKAGQFAEARDIGQRYDVLRHFRPLKAKERLQRWLMSWKLNIPKPSPDKKTPQL